MRTELLGLTLHHALDLLKSEGIEPQVEITAAPKAADRAGVLRVVYLSDDASTLIAARFVDPVADGMAAKA